MNLTLQFKQCREVINFADNLTFFHGQVSAGKSSIARMIDFCFAGDLERTTAMAQEFVSAQLEAKIANYDVLIEREYRSNQLVVSWTSEKGASTVIAPVNKDTDAQPILGEDIYNFSDLMFYFFNIAPLKVRRSKADVDSPLISLSFRDILWYCYLEQDHLDSSFYSLQESFKLSKSRDVMRFIVGFYSERLNDLEIKLEETISERRGKQEAAKQLREFLEQFGYGTVEDVAHEVSTIETQLLKLQTAKNVEREEYDGKTHFADQLRDQLRGYSRAVEEQQLLLADIDQKIKDQEELKAELVLSKFKLARVSTTAAVLSGVEFDFCPCCGRKVKKQTHADEDCSLCGSHTQIENTRSAELTEATRKDVTARIEELIDSVRRLKRARIKQTQTVSEIAQHKLALDKQLVQELSHYDSAYVARIKQLERETATLSERLSFLRRVMQMPAALNKLEQEAEQLKSTEQNLRQQLFDERKKLTKADSLVTELENIYLSIMLSIGVPGVRPNDKVYINRRTWIPEIWPDGEKALSWGFYNGAGSGGKKTLMNVAYALAVHKLASDHNLPLPTLLIIDTPSKNIGEDVNQDLFDAVYSNVYELAADSLRSTQFIIIDNKFVPAPSTLDLQMTDRFMSRSDPTHPPLIPYYDGP